MTWFSHVVLCCGICLWYHRNFQNQKFNFVGGFFSFRFGRNISTKLHTVQLEITAIKKWVGDYPMIIYFLTTSNALHAKYQWKGFDSILQKFKVKLRIGSAYHLWQYVSCNLSGKVSKTQLVKSYSTYRSASLNELCSFDFITLFQTNLIHRRQDS